LADRTIGRAFGTLCRLSVICRLSVMFCIVASHSRAPGNMWVRVSFTTGAVWSAILATAGLLVIFIFAFLLPI